MDLVAKRNVEGRDQVGSDQTSKTRERLLAKANPWRVADSEEDGMIITLLRVLWKEGGGCRHGGDGESRSRGKSPGECRR